MQLTFLLVYLEEKNIRLSQVSSVNLHWSPNADDVHIVVHIVYRNNVVLTDSI